VDIDVSRSKLLDLLASATETASLDFKEKLDLDDAASRIETFKDIGAMMDRGGYLVIGADSQGRPSGGVDDRQSKLLDDANLRGKLSRYVPAPFDIATAVHEVGGVRMAVIQVLPHPTGCCVFAANGQYPDPKDPTGKTMKVAFRKGDIFTRHGSRSELIEAHDLARIRAKGAAAATPTLDMTDDEFEIAVETAFRQADKVSLLKLLNTAVDAASAAVSEGAGARLVDILNRLTCFAALAIRYDELPWLDETLRRFEQIYERPFAGDVRTPGGRPRVWLDLVGHVVALGAFVVSHGRLDLVPRLVLRTPTAEPFSSGRYTNWIRHADVEAGRAEFYKSPKGEMSFLRGIAVEQGSLRCVNPAADLDKFQSHLAQFDVLATIAVWGHAPGDGEYPYWPSYAAFEGYYYEPAVARLVSNPELLATIYPPGPATLRELLAALEKQHHHGNRFGGGWPWADATVVAFIRGVNG